MAKELNTSVFPMVGGGFILLLIICVGAYMLLGPGAQTPARASVNLPGEPVTGEPVRTASGLEYYELREGTGPTPGGPSTRVKVHYTGWLMNGKKFDSSVDRGEPTEFALSGVIPGWTEGVGSMKVGGKRKLVIPSSLGYGPAGMPPDIPGNAKLVFDIELIEIVG